MKGKISKKKVNAFLDFIANYYDENPKELEKIAERLYGEYFEEGTAVFVTSVAMVAIALLGGYAFDDEHYSDFCKYFHLKDYKKCLEICEYLHGHAYYALTVEWNSYPKLLSRHLLVSARCNLSELMYAVMAAFRCEGYHLVDLTHKGEVFEPIYSIINSDSMSPAKPGEIAGISLISRSAKSTVMYDFGDGWEFNIRFRKPVIITDNEEYPHVILQKGKGYGIFEDNRYILENFIEDPDFLFDGQMVKNMIPFNFYDAELDDLKESIEEEFERLRFVYSGGNEDDDLDSYEELEEESNGFIS